MAIITWDNDSEILTFDVTKSEGNISKSEVSKFARESGAPLTDHVRTMAADVTLSVFVSNSPLHKGKASVTEVTAFRVVGSARQIKVTPQKYDRPPGPTPGAVLTKLVSVVGDALFGDGPDISFKGSKFSVVAETVRFASMKREVNGDRRIELVDTLEKLRLAKTKVSVFTAVGYYPDRVISGIEFKRDRPTDGLTVDLTFERVDEAETQRSDLPKTRVSRAKAPEIKGAPGEGKGESTSLLKRGLAIAKANGIDLGL